VSSTPLVAWKSSATTSGFPPVELPDHGVDGMDVIQRPQLLDGPRFPDDADVCVRHPGRTPGYDITQQYRNV